MSSNVVTGLYNDNNCDPLLVARLPYIHRRLIKMHLVP